MLLGAFLWFLLKKQALGVKLGSTPAAYLFGWRYALRRLHYRLDGAVLVIVQLIYADGAAVAAAGRQGAVVVEKVALALVVDDAGVGGEAVGYIALDNAAVDPGAGGAGGRAVFYHLGLSAGAGVHEVVQLFTLVYPRALDVVLDS